MDLDWLCGERRTSVIDMNVATMRSARDDVENSFSLLLGRRASPPSAIVTMMELSPRNVLRRVDGSAEFENTVVKALLEQRLLPHERRSPRPPAALVDWFCSVMQLNEDGRDVLRAAPSWAEFIRLLFQNQDVAEKMFRKSLVDAVRQEAAARAAPVVAPVVATAAEPPAAAAAVVAQADQAALKVDGIVPEPLQNPAAPARPEPAAPAGARIRFPPRPMS
ncbi:hypothetical protein ACFFMP_02300 [Pseudoroseomonas cervicalis]|uniref:hypothetical protein n=1 Tax=Teichococcus cervicalis TaxID=204525 RepID=UPI0035F033B5